jgi:hypothetical protein
MDEYRDPLSSRLEALARELEDVRRRLDRLEARHGLPAATPTGDQQGGAAALEDARVAPPLPAAPAGTIAFIGRSLVVLAGAFLLRGLTDAGLLPGRVGALAGLAYAAGSLVAADRDAAGGRRTSAVFHGFAAVLIAYPLLWEVTARFALLSPAASASALLAVFGLGMVVAWRQGLGELAWANVFFAVLTSMGLLVRTRDLMSFTVTLLLIAVAVEGLAFHDRWLGLRWPVAIVLDLAIATVAMVELREGGPPEGYPALSAKTLVGIGLALAVVYLTGMALRTLRHGRPVTPFEMLQIPTALLLGYGGAASVMVASGRGLTALGALALVLGATGYALSFSFLERRAEFGRNFYAYTTLGGSLTLVGTRLVLPGAAAATAWSALAVGVAFLGARFGRMTLKVHGALYLIAAATASGLFAHAADALLGAPTQTWRVLSAAGVIALTAAALSYALLAPGGRARGERPSRRLPAAMVAATLGWSLAGVLAGGLARALAGAPGPNADAALVAAVRTAVIAGMAVVLAGVAGRRFLPELTWLVHATLAAGAVQLLVGNLGPGRPITLFVAFALYGGALVAVPRLMQRP